MEIMAIIIFSIALATSIALAVQEYEDIAEARYNRENNHLL